MDSNGATNDSNPATELRVYRARHNLSQRGFAKLAGIPDAAAISRFETGAERPGLVLASRIERVTGIPASSWVAAAELGHFAEQRVENLANSDEPASASVGRGRGAAA